jgi:hypothetical protein
MSTRAPRLCCSPALRLRSVISALMLVGAASFTTGCGSSGSMSEPPAPTLTGNTSVTVMLTGMANDQLAEFDLGFQSITLTSQSGKTATLLSLPTSGPAVGAEFMHINGLAEPLVTASIPQDIYTSATVSLSGAEFVCVDLSVAGAGGQGTLDTSVFDDLGMPASAVTVTLPSPITVTGTSMGISLDLLVSQSATYSSCYDQNGIYSYSITPTFNLTALTLSSSPTTAANGRVTGLDGQITAIGTAGSNITLSIPDAEGARPISVTFGGHTVYQGVNNFSALASGMFVDIDGTIQSDGSLLATRVAVEDSSAADVLRGPVTQVAPSVSAFLMMPREHQGSSYVGGSEFYNSGDAALKVSGQITNLASLPFVPSFTTSNMVPGQEVYISVAAIPTDGSYPVATTMTLMPQTINGTVIASSQSGNFTDYTVSLASYDLFPMLAVQPNQTTVENNPSQVEVYVDSNTQLLNAQRLAAGSTLRFYGLVFNDNGTLRMDCAQVNDGVPETTASSAAQEMRLEKGTVQQIGREGSGSLQQVVSMIRR